MRNRDVEFSNLINRVRGGSQEAAWELMGRYADLVFRVVRSRMPHRFRRLFDSQDFVQVVWGSVFRHRSRLVRFDSAGQFAAFLTKITTNKVGLEIRRRLRQKRHCIDAETPFTDVGHVDLAVGPTPSQMAMARERWFRLLRQQPPHHQEAVRLSFLGHSPRDIAERVGLNEGSVRRILANLLKGASP